MKSKTTLVFLLVILLLVELIERSMAQGLNHTFLLGYTTGLDTNVTSYRSKIDFDSMNITILPQSFNMPFGAAQANISDENGNLLFYTNGCWIADSNGSLMQNGDGLNQGTFTDNYCNQNDGIPYIHADMILPWPGDSLKYILMHQTGNYSMPDMMSSELYSTRIDMSLNGGLGAAYMKNTVVIQDTLNPGMTACKHANGRDWWIVIFKDNSDIVFKMLLTPLGITSITTQHLNVPFHTGYSGQPQFSPDGTKFAYHYMPSVVNPVSHEIRLFNFDRCSGFFSNGNIITAIDSSAGFGLSFSPNSKYLYFSSFFDIYQLNTDTTNIAASIQNVAHWDGFCYPYNFTCSVFWPMYLAANGKIYVVPSNSIYLNYINSPDSAGLESDVQQHAIRTPCYFFRSNVNHPNYYLGPVIGSICDSLTGLSEHEFEIRNLKITPNPLSNGILKITYLLPQNQSGIFEVYDLNGRLLFHQPLSTWSSLQYFDLSLLSTGLYQCVIRSGNSIATQKLVVLQK